MVSFFVFAMLAQMNISQITPLKVVIKYNFFNTFVV